MSGRFGPGKPFHARPRGDFPATLTTRRCHTSWVLPPFDDRHPLVYRTGMAQTWCSVVAQAGLVQRDRLQRDDGGITAKPIIACRQDPTSYGEASIVPSSAGVATGASIGVGSFRELAPAVPTPGVASMSRERQSQRPSRRSVGRWNTTQPPIPGPVGRLARHLPSDDHWRNYRARASRRALVIDAPLPGFRRSVPSPAPARFRRCRSCPPSRVPACRVRQADASLTDSGNGQSWGVPTTRRAQLPAARRTVSPVRAAAIAASKMSSPRRASSGVTASGAAPASAAATLR